MILLWCSNDPNKSHKINIAQHIPSGYSITTLRNHNQLKLHITEKRIAFKNYVVI